MWSYPLTLPRAPVRAGASPGLTRIARLALAAGSARYRPHRLHRVRLGRGLVVAVALHAREAQRHPSRVAAGGLDAVEGDLDDLLGPDVDGVAVAVGLELLEALRLPGQQLVGEPLEGLAEHREALAVARAEVQVGEEAAAAAVAPLRGEHDEVERVHRLDLQPRRAAAPGGVGRFEVLDHHALVAACERVVEDRLCG